MKSTMKRMIAFILAVCTVVGFAVPSVFATGDTGAAEGGSADTGAATLNSVTYDLAGWYDTLGAKYIFAGGIVQQSGPAIQSAYDAGTSNWKPEAGTVMQVGLRDGYLLLETQPGKESGMTYFAIRIKSPGAGKYKLNYAYTQGNNANNVEMDYGNVYIIPAPATPYDKYTVSGAVSGQTPAVEVSYDHNTPGVESMIQNAVQSEEYVFEADKEYVVIFGGKETDAPLTSGNASMYLRSFTLDEQPADPEKELNVVKYDLVGAQNLEGVGSNYIFAGGIVQINGPKLAEHYDAGRSNWEAETGTVMQVKLYEDYMRTDTQLSNASAMTYFAIRIKSPGAGVYKMNYAYTQTNYASNSEMDYGNVFILPAPETPYTKYTIAGAVKDKTPLLEVTYDHNTAGQEGAVAAEALSSEYIFEADKEYIVVFGGKETDAPITSGSAYMFMRSFTLEEQDVDVEDLDSVLYDIHGWKGTIGEKFVFAGGAVRAEAQPIQDAYDAGTSNWKIETGTVMQAKMYPGYLRTETQLAKTGAQTYFAIRIKSPGEGVYKLNYMFSQSNYSSNPEMDYGSVYILPAPETPYDKNTITNAVKDRAPVLTLSYDHNTAGITSAQGANALSGAYAFEADKEYIVVFGGKEVDAVTTESNAYMYLRSFTLDEQLPGTQPDVSEPVEPEVPKWSYTDGLYNFNDIKVAGGDMSEAKDVLAAMYEADNINWKYEAVGGGLQLAKITYHSPTDSVRAISAKDWWLAVRIKAPSQDGQYSIQMTHGATGDGAPAGSIYVIPGDTPTNQIFKVASKNDPTMTTNWNYGEKTSDSIKGRVSDTGTVNLKAGEEYIVVFLPTEKNTINGNACFYLGQLQVTRTGDYVEEEGSGDEVDGVEYEFYDWDNPGNYVNHYKTEEQLGKKIVHQQIAQKYAAGEMNWCYFGGNGYASFSTGTPYLSVGVAETYYYVLKIKAPGTGTYEITYNHMAMKDAKAGAIGGVYIIPYEEGMDSNIVRDEANFKNPIISTSYYADKTTEVQVKGTYTAFQEGKEYLICFSADDTDVKEVKTLNAFPVSMVMKRVGEYVPEVEGSGAYGITYNLALPEFSGKRHDKDNVKETIAQRYENGIMNWKLENGVGYAQFYSKYTQFATGYGGLCWAIRIKAPGTGEYKVNLDYIKNFDTRAANVGKIYIKEAPEETIPSGSLNSHLVQLPIMDITYNCGGIRMQRTSASGSYMFKEGKEYIVFFYGQDNMDPTNPNTTTFMYVERLVMQRIGEYVETEKALAEGGIVAENVLTQFKTEAYVLAEINGHDYLAFCLFGGTMLIYDLDEWRLIDEVQIGIDSPHAMTVDKDGNWWIGGGQYLYCYNPYTREGFMTGKVSSGGQCLNMFSDPEEDYVYYPVYSDNCVILYRLNTKTLEFKGFNMESWSRYSGPGGVIKGDYIYMTATGGTRNEVWKVNKHTGKIAARVDVTHRTKGERYIYNMSAMGDNHLLVYSDYGVTAVDTRDMSLLYDDAVGNLRGTTSRIASDPIDGKCYFVTNVEGLCYFDLETETFGTVGGELANYKTGLRFTNMATIDDSRLTEESMVAFGGMTASGVSLFAINLETKIAVELIGLVEPSMGTGVNASTLFKGEPGTNEIIYGPMYPDFPARVYNAATGELARTFWTKGQNDSYVWYNGKMYFGNYNNAILCEMNNGQPTQLFTLNDKNFDQSRVHGICGGDNKVFIGTIPDNFVMGGVIAWYDLDTGLTYVVTGPNPEDVYYAKASQMMTTNEWYSVVTGELVNMADEWDNDNDGDGVYDHFQGPIPYQSIVQLNYSDGLLYGVSSLRAGSGAGETPNGTSVIFIYDVENMKMLKTVELADYIDGVPSRIRTIKSLNADPDISNKMWGMVSETLFSMTYDRDTNKVNIKEEISFNKTGISASSSACTQISFEGDYLYALFGPIGGLLKVNRYDTSDYTKVMGDFETTNQVPSSFILGDDGDIYYISTSSPHIYVLNADITDEDRASAKAVQDAIDLIPETVTLADRGIIEAARAAWDVMPKANQPLVNNLKKLENAEIALLVLRIDALSDNITIEDEAELMAIRAEYMALDVSQRTTIDFKKVSDAESKMSILRGIRTTDLIDSIGTVTLDKEQLIRDARASFMALSRYERTLVANIELLNSAEAQLTGLILQRNEAAAVDKLIDEIGFVFFSDSKIKIAREAYDKLSDGAKEMVTKYDALKKAETLLIVEYVLVVVLIVVGAAITVVILRKKKVKATEE